MDNYNNLKPVKNSLQDLYIKGNKDMSISRWRNNLLIEFMNKQKDFKVAMRDIISNEWTSWKSPLQFSTEQINSCYDLHRSVLYNEILVEADNPTYEENRESTIYIGKILEDKGYTPLYWYSGSKSIHCSIFIDFTRLFNIEQDLQKRIIDTFNTKKQFITEFMAYIREQIITCFGLNNIQFDRAFLKPNHLIRCELSLNKKGFKTFLGYSCKDIPKEPPICSFENLEYPQTISEIKESFDNSPESVIIDFLKYYEVEQQKRNLRAKMTHNQGEFKLKTLRPGIKFILTEDFMKYEDGRKRGLFLLANELKQIHSKEEAIKILKEWNAKMNFPFPDKELEYRVNSAHVYKITNKFINDFVNEFKR